MKTRPRICVLCWLKQVSKRVREMCDGDNDLLLHKTTHCKSNGPIGLRGSFHGVSRGGFALSAWLMVSFFSYWDTIRHVTIVTSTTAHPAQSRATVMMTSNAKASTTREGWALTERNEIGLWFFPVLGYLFLPFYCFLRSL